jgi:hypothetical protein
VIGLPEYSRVAIPGGIVAVADKKYQIFISSTFTDLVEERQLALKAILDLGHIPSGMEAFPAIDMD